MMALYKPLPLGVLKTIEATSNSTSQPPKAFWINLPKALSVPNDKQQPLCMPLMTYIHNINSGMLNRKSLPLGLFKKNKIHPHNRLMPSNTF